MSYKKALKSDISEGTQTVAQRHFTTIQQDRLELQRLFDGITK